MRKPDNVVWSWPWRYCCFGIAWDLQEYGANATCFTLCIGPLTLRWHRR
jgi:hypothetical protein